MMKHTVHDISIVTAFIVCLSQLPPVSTAAEIDTGKPTLQSQPTKDGTNGGSETRKEPRENEDPSNKLDALKLDRDLLQSKVEDLQRQLETTQQELASGKKGLNDLNARVVSLEKEKGQLAAALTEARDQARDLTTKLAAEQVKAATLREDKQRLMSEAVD
jgi:chromosome segregation ATPase